MRDRLRQGDVGAIDVEAAGWIAQLSGGKFSNEDRAALREWCERSPAHRDAIRRLAGVWAELDVLSELPSELGPKQSDKTAHKRLEWSPFWLAHAVVFAFVAVFAGIWIGDKTLINMQDAPIELYATKIGEQRIIELSDKSTIQLNTNSLVEVDYGPQERRVRLVKGEALFDVAKDEQRAFAVHAAANTIQAVGTKFAVRLLFGNVQVIVSEGTVTVYESGGATSSGSGPAGSSTLGARQLAIIDDRAAGSIEIGTIDAKELERRMSWTTGILDFDGEPLAEVVAEVSRYTPLNIKIVQPDLGQLTVGGRFRVGDTEALFEVIEAGFGAKVIHQDDVVLITSN